MSDFGIPGFGDALYSLGENQFQDPRSNRWHMDNKPIHPILEAVCINPNKVVSIPRHFANNRTFIVPSGIGDIAWLYAKLVNLNEPIVFCVAGQAKQSIHTAIAQRAFPFLDLLDNVVYSSLALCSSESVYWASVATNYTNCHIPSSPAYLACNRWLEKGQKLDYFLPNIKTTRHFNMRKPKWAYQEADLFLKKDELAFAIYPSSKDYFGDQNVALSGWIKTIKALISSHPDHKVILLGSPWDLSMLIPLYDAVCSIGYSERVLMMHDRDFAVSIEVLRRCQFFVGAVSGLTIVAEYQRVPTVHIYPEQLYKVDKLINTWESPEMVSNGLSLSLRAGDDVEENIEKMFDKFSPLKSHAVQIR